MEVYAYCCLCNNKIVIETETPEGWEGIDTIEIEDALCPKHSIINEFIGSQCSGCADRWAECNLWKNFAYKNSWRLSDVDFEKLRVGICPKRVSGTILFKDNKVEDVDLSEQAPDIAGEALVKAIKEYWERNFKDEQSE